MTATIPPVKPGEAAPKHRSASFGKSARTSTATKPSRHLSNRQASDNTIPRWSQPRRCSRSKAQLTVLTEFPSGTRHQAGSRMLRWALIEAIPHQPAGSRPRAARDSIIARRGKQARNIAKSPPPTSS